MVAEPRLWGDVEGAVRSWARSVLRSIDGRVFLSFQSKNPTPQVVLFRVDGPDDACLFQFDVWAKDTSRAAEVAAELATAADNLSLYVANNVKLYGAVVVSSIRQPDPESDIARYVVDVIFTAMALPVSPT